MYVETSIHLQIEWSKNRENNLYKIISSNNKYQNNYIGISKERISERN